jgi:hypothetical protein
MEDTIICNKCKGQMKKKGVMISGNTRYNEYECIKCGNKMLKAIGIEK